MTVSLQSVTHSL